MKYLVFLLPLAAFAFAVPPTEAPDAKAVITGEDAAKRVTVPEGLTVSLWASEPLMANPVAFTFSGSGICYVAETTRFDHGVPDTRGHMNWLDDDIGARTVADRLAMYERHKYGGYEKYDDQIRRVWDSNGSGKADKSNVFAKGFNKPEDGLMAGILAHRGSIYATCIPSLYRFNDTHNSGVNQTVLSTGYGVRVQYLGHDLHGLRMGPDGRLYFSIGDRGFHVVTKEGKTLSNPDSGAVLRCEPDGSNLEIVHVGLRNPQELAFDDFGNLFTYDNNCDSGDKARWVQIVPGGDSGWRCGYQYGTLYHTPSVKQGNRGPWNTEGLWHTAEEGQPAYIVPPLAHFGNGPAGITHYPGLGLNESYKDHFFACDFTSNAGSSVIWSLAVKSKGASFEVVDLKPFVKNMVPTDCEFGPDCNFYWSDWVSGWNPQGKGRIFKVTDAVAQKNPKVKEAKELLAGGIRNKSNVELLKLLEHPHQQVRQEAQFEFAALSLIDKDVLNDLIKYSAESKSQIGRLHALWALGQIYRKAEKKPVPIAELLTDADPIIRGNAAMTLSEATKDATQWYDTLFTMLNDPEPFVQAKSAYALAKLSHSKPVAQQRLSDITDFISKVSKDPYLRHAAVKLLIGFQPQTVGDLAPIAAVINKPSKIAYILTMRQNTTATAEQRWAGYLSNGLPIENNPLFDARTQKQPWNTYLLDSDPAVASEAARAVYDERHMDGMPYLADLYVLNGLPDAVIIRSLAANYLLGGVPCATNLAKYAARKTAPDYLRVIALKLLADWENPPRRDPITGLTLTLPKRKVSDAQDALKPVLDDIFSGSDLQRKEAVACVSKLGIKEVGRVLAGLVSDAKLPAETRVDALYALADLKAGELGEVLPIAAMATEPKLKAAARIVRVKSNPKVVEEFPDILSDAKTSMIEKQMILAVLGTLGESAAADKLLGEWLEKLIAGDVPPELKLEIFESAEARANAKKLKTYYDFKAKLADYDKAVRKIAGSKTDKRFPEALAGGDAAHGRAVFLNNAAVSCQRCHKLDGEGGDVGPPVNGLGKEKTREYLLESIVLPDAHIAEGYASVILELSDGKKVSGVLRKKTKEKYTLLTPENKVLEIPAGDVESEKPDKSAMPDDVYKKLTRREMRDLVEFLASLKEKK